MGKRVDASDPGLAGRTEDAAPARLGRTRFQHGGRACVVRTAPVTLRRSASPPTSYVVASPDAPRPPPGVVSACLFVLSGTRPRSLKKVAVATHCPGPRPTPPLFPLAQPTYT